MARALLATSLQHPAPRCDGQHKGHNHGRAYAVHGEAPKPCTRCFLVLAEQLQSPVPSGVIAALAFSPSQSLTPSLYPRLPTQRCPWAQQLPSANCPRLSTELTSLIVMAISSPMCLNIFARVQWSFQIRFKGTIQNRFAQSPRGQAVSGLPRSSVDNALDDRDGAAGSGSNDTTSASQRRNKTCSLGPFEVEL